MYNLEDALILAQAHIISRFTGRSMGAELPPARATSRDRPLPAFDDGDSLLELHGIPANRYRRASVFELASELAHGHVAVVYAHEPLWPPSEAPEAREAHGGGSAGVDEPAASAVVIASIDTSDPHETWIIAIEPGRDDAVTRHAFAYFLLLWRGRDITVVATQEPAPAWWPEMARFDYSAGHLPTIAGLAFHQFIALADNPGLLHAHLERQRRHRSSAIDVPYDGEANNVLPSRFECDAMHPGLP